MPFTGKLGVLTLIALSPSASASLHYSAKHIHTYFNPPTSTSKMASRLALRSLRTAGKCLKDYKARKKWRSKMDGHEGEGVKEELGLDVLEIIEW
jgi:hypothetical protein